MYFNLLQISTSAQPILVMSMRRALTQTAPSSVRVVLVLMEMARFAKVRRRSLVNELMIFYIANALLTFVRNTFFPCATIGRSRPRVISAKRRLTSSKCSWKLDFIAFNHPQ